MAQTKPTSHQITYDGGTAQDVLDQAKPLSNYTALRAYTGRASGVRITTPGIAGVFYKDTDDAISADNGGTIIVTSAGVRWKRLFIGSVYVDWFGTATSQSLVGADSIADSYDAFSRCIAYCSSVFYYGFVALSSGYYRLTQPLDVNIRLQFIGQGSLETYLHADHVLGPAIRFRQGGSGFKYLGVTASATRRAAAYGAGLNFGVLFEGDDVPEGSTGAPRLLHCIADDFYIYGHPQGGMHVVGPAFTGVIQSPNISNIKGHGISFDRGEATSRVNLISTTISGVCRVSEGRINNCGGHAIAAGSPASNFSTPSLRIVIDNIEGDSNATDAAVRYYNSPVYLRGTNHVFQNSGLTVSGGGYVATVAGRNIHLKNNRALGSYAGFYLIATYDELPTNGVYIDGMTVINPAAPLDPAITFTLPAGELIRPQGLHLRQGETATITRLIGTDATLGSTDFRGVANVTINGRPPLIFKPADSTVNNSTTLVNDSDLKGFVSAGELVEFEFNIEYSGTGTADIKMAVGTPSASTYFRYSCGASSIKVGTTDTATVQSIATGTISLGCGGTGVARTAVIKGICQVGANDGYIGLQWAQLVAEASDTIVHSGISSLRLTRIIK